MRNKATKASERFACDVSTNLLRARKKRELSQDALAIKAGLDRKTINRIENNHFSPSMDTFFRICGALGVKPVDMVRAKTRK